MSFAPILNVKHMRGTVLLIEDDPSVADLINEIFATYGIDTVSVRSAQEAKDAWRKDAPRIRLILADLIVNGECGLHIVSDLLRHGASVPIAYLTACANVSEKTLSIHSGRPVTLIQKPFTIDRLRSVLKSAMPELVTKPETSQRL